MGASLRKGVFIRREGCRVDGVRAPAFWLLRVANALLALLSDRDNDTRPHN